MGECMFRLVHAWGRALAWWWLRRCVSSQIDVHGSPMAQCSRLSIASLSFSRSSTSSSPSDASITAEPKSARARGIATATSSSAREAAIRGKRLEHARRGGPMLREGRGVLDRRGLVDRLEQLCAVLIDKQRFLGIEIGLGRALIRLREGQVSTSPFSRFWSWTHTHTRPSSLEAPPSSALAPS
jgi:hypothetical protein